MLITQRNFLVLGCNGQGSLMEEVKPEGRQRLESLWRVLCAKLESVDSPEILKGFHRRNNISRCMFWKDISGDEVLTSAIPCPAFHILYHQRQLGKTGLIVRTPAQSLGWLPDNKIQFFTWTLRKPGIFSILKLFSSDSHMLLLHFIHTRAETSCQGDFLAVKTSTSIAP